MPAFFHVHDYDREKRVGLIRAHEKMPQYTQHLALEEDDDSSTSTHWRHGARFAFSSPCFSREGDFFSFCSPPFPASRRCLLPTCVASHL